MRWAFPAHTVKAYDNKAGGGTHACEQHPGTHCTESRTELTMIHLVLSDDVATLNQSVSLRGALARSRPKCGGCEFLIFRWPFTHIERSALCFTTIPRGYWTGITGSIPVPHEGIINTSTAQLMGWRCLAATSIFRHREHPRLRVPQFDGT